MKSLMPPPSISVEERNARAKRRTIQADNRGRQCDEPASSPVAVCLKYGLEEQRKRYKREHDCSYKKDDNGNDQVRGRDSRPYTVH